MPNEIERKFLVKEMPDLSGLQQISYERYYLKRDSHIEERIQRKGEKYEYEKKERISDLERTSEKKEITKEEFEKLREGASAALIRESYILPDHPGLSIKIYKGTYEGLIRAEVEFSSVEEANVFTPYEWMGKEITNSPLGKDSKLLDLTRETFQELLRNSL